MYYKRVFITISIVMVHLNIFAQDGNFRLSDFKLPDIRYHELEFNVNFSNSRLRQDIESSSSFNETVKTNHLINLVSIRYIGFKNLERYQENSEILVSSDADIYKEEIDNDRYYEGNMFYQALARYESRIYFNPFFVEAQPEVSYTSSIQKVTNPVGSDSRLKNGFNEIYISSPVGVGFGRLEPVQDARLAIYILEEFVDKGIISEMPDNRLIYAFAKKISEVKNSRFFDIRIRDIEDMKMIDTFLRDLGIIESGDIAYHTTLSDQWDYASLPLRLSGFRLNFGFDNAYSSILDFDDGYTDTGLPNPEKETIRSLSYYGIYLETQYHRPHNLYFQSEALFRLNRRYLRLSSDVDPEDYMGNYNSKIFNTQLSYLISYIPNSRTIATIGLNAEFALEDILLDDIPVYVNSAHLITESIYISPEFLVSYYISPRFRLSLSGNIKYIPEKFRIEFVGPYREQSIDQDLITSNISFGLIYKIF